MSWKKQLYETLCELKNWAVVEQESVSHEITALRQDIHEAPMLLVVGEFNAGKSTFINALLGEKVLTSDIIPATAVVTKLTYGETEEVIGHFGDGSSKNFSLSWLEGLTAEREGNLESIRYNLSHIELKLPKERLKQVTIIDSPGLNSGYERHTVATTHFMKRAEEIIWLFNYQNLGTKTELSQLRKIKELGLIPYGVVNRIDLHDDEEESLEDFLEGSIGRVSGLVKGIIGVSALEAIEGKVEADPDKLKWSNWEAVKPIITNIEKDKNQKANRIFSRLYSVMKELQDKFILQEKEIGKAIGNKYNFNTFLHNKLPVLKEERDLLNSEQENANQLHNHYKKIFSKSLSVEEFDMWMNRYIKLQEKSESFQLWKNTILPLYQSFTLEVRFYHRSLEASYSDYEHFRKEWDEFKLPPLFSKRALKLKLKESEKYQTLTNELEKKREKLDKSREVLNKHLKEMYSQLNCEIEELYNVYFPSLTARGTKWNSVYKKSMNQFNGFEKTVLNEMRIYIGSLHAYLEILKPIFTKEIRELTIIEPFQKSKYVFRETQLISHFYPAPDTIEELEIFRDFGEWESDSHKKIAKHKVKEIELESIKKPNGLELDLEPYNRQITTKRSTAIVAISIILFLTFIFTYDENGFFTKMNNDENETLVADASSYSGDDIEDVEELDTYEEYSISDRWPREEFIEFYDRMMAELISRIDSNQTFNNQWFSKQGFADFSTYYQEISNGSHEEYEVTNVTYLTDQVELRALESYVVNNGINTYDVHYTMSPIENTLEIINVDFKLVEKEEQIFTVSEEELSQFIQDFRSDYQTSLNQANYSTVSPYLLKDGLADREIEEYINSLFNKGYQFEFITDEVKAVEKTDDNVYQIITNEEFIYDKGNGDQTYYQKQKRYHIRILDEHSFSIEEIENLDTKKEQIIERTIDLVDDYDISSWMTSYYHQFIESMNTYGFENIENYYDSESEEYNETKDYIEYVQGRKISTKNLDFQVLGVSEHTETEVAVDVYTEDRFFYPEGDGDTKKIEATYIVGISKDGQMKIRELLDLEILEETEFIWGNEE